jgi:hypothetical protein
MIEIISISSEGRQSYIIDLNDLDLDDEIQSDFKLSIDEVIKQKKINNYRKKNSFGDFDIIDGEIIQYNYASDSFLWRIAKAKRTKVEHIIEIFNHD